MNKEIAVVILNYIQFLNIKPGIDQLIKLGYNIDVFTGDRNSQDSSGFTDMFDNIYEYLKTNKYQVLDRVPNKKYKILLEPYPLKSIDAEYKIKYRYSILSAKPNIVYNPESYVYYDAILCNSKIEANYLNAFSKTYLIPNLKYVNFKKVPNKNTKKLTLLYLPTYGAESSIFEIVDNLTSLRDEFYIVTKVHHGTSFLKNESIKLEKLKNNVDKFYDYEKDLTSLLKYVDVVLTDNSGSLFEALYTGVPVALFATDINKNKIGSFNTIQYDLVQQNLIPYTNSPKELSSIIKKSVTQSVIKKQKKWAKEFLHYSKDPVNDFVKIIEQHINDDIDLKYYKIHDLLRTEYFKNLNLLEKLPIIEKEQKELQAKIVNITTDYERVLSENKQLKNRKLYKLAAKIYKIKDGE